jgi:hypothetical protein
MAAVDSSSAMAQITPYRLILKLSWNKKRPASSDFTLGKRKKSAEGDIWQVVRLAKHLFTYIRV